MARIYFGIPLRARAASSNWAMVEANLMRTLGSLLSQESDDVRVVIAGHDQPDSLRPYVADGRVRFIDVSSTAPIPSGVEGFNGDKAAKKNWIGYAIREIEPEPLYFMHMDADDLMHRRLARDVAASDNKTGYLIERGWMIDVANRLAAPADETTTQFYRHCGSCALVYFTPDELPRSPTHYRSPFSKYRNHTRYEETARGQGKPLQAFGRYVGAYLVNHGENNRSYRGANDKKVGFVERHAVSDPALLNELARDFHGLDAILGVEPASVATDA